jgi:hypothetical protein
MIQPPSSVMKGKRRAMLTRPLRSAVASQSPPMTEIKKHNRQHLEFTLPKHLTTTKNMRDRTPIVLGELLTEVA